MSMFTRTLTKEEIKKILTLWDRGYLINCIVKKTSHCHGTVRKYLKLNGRYE